MGKKEFLYLLFSCFIYSLSANTFLITNGLTHEHNVENGRVYRGSINVKNLTTTEKSIKVYIQDYRYYATGDVFYEDPSLMRNQRSNAGWITFSANFVTLKPESKHELQYEIHVPDSLTREGTFWSMIMVEGVDDVNFDDVREDKIQIRSLVRYGVQIVTNVGSHGEKDLAFQNFKLNYDEHKVPNLLFDILNTGTLLLKPEFKLELFNEQGQSVKVVKTKGSRIYPQTSTRNTISIDDLDSGVYKALVLVDTQDDDVFATEINVDIKND